MIYAIFSVFYSINYAIPDSCDAEWPITYLRLDIQRLTRDLFNISIDVGIAIKSIIRYGHIVRRTFTAADERPAVFAYSSLTTFANVL